MTDIDSEMDIFTQTVSSVIDRQCDPNIAAGVVMMYRAALARAAAAEALINEYHERTVAAEREASLCANALETARSRWAEAERREKSIFDDAMGIADQRDALVTRVAELEAQLAGDV